MLQNDQFIFVCLYILYVDTYKLPPGTLFVLHTQNSPNI